MSYTAAVEHLYALSGELAPASPGAPRRKFDLEHMRTLAAALGDPHRKFPAVLIGGTNGKGSTAATLASILSVSGYRTGLYTSPHLLRVNERIQISGVTPGANSLAEIDDDTFARLYFQVDDAANRLVAEGALPHAPSFFEVITAIAFVAFAEAGIDIAVLEVGLGGRLDATNIVEPLLSVITDISLDHTEWLGNTLTEIAREKAGILRQGGILVTLPQHPEANAAIGEVAMALDVTGINAAD
jgi:dihydrofolate synthase/folylpolyglutamate synthase